MEFYENIAAKGFDSHRLQPLLSIHNLPALCSSIDSILSDNKTSGVIYCLWGQYDINREEIKNGVRFSLPGCPNALAWTVTFHQEIITVHCTINKMEHDADFIASIYTFMADWAKGMRPLTTP